MSDSSPSSLPGRLPFRVLVVDDEETVREILGHLLGEAGYRVTAVGSAEEGLAALQRDPFDLLVLDLGRSRGREPDIGRITGQG